MILITVEIKTELSIQSIHEATNTHTDHIIFDGSVFDFLIKFNAHCRAKVEYVHEDISFTILNVCDLGDITEHQLDQLMILQHIDLTYLEG